MAKWVESLLPKHPESGCSSHTQKQLGPAGNSGHTFNPSICDGGQVGPGRAL